MTRSAFRRRPALWAAACLVTLLSCVDGNSVGTELAVSIDFVPSFQVVPGDFSSGPIEAIRTRVLNAGTLVPISTSETTVDPAAAEWLLNLAVNLNGAESLSVIVEVELLSGGVVAWSGRLGPILAQAGLSTSIQSVPVYRGPLDNLDVEAVTIVGAPAQILVGSTGTATSEVTLPVGSTANPEVFWVSLDPTIATVVVDAGVATITGVATGTATIAAAAGPEFDEVEVEVLGRVQSVTVDPPSTSVLGTGQTVQFTASVLDGFGNPAPGEPVTWSSSDEAVATVDATGLATSQSTGTAEIRATAAGVTGFGTLTVDPPLAEIVWLGTVDSNWDNGANWLGGAVPTPVDDVIIRDAPNLPDLASATVIGALTIESPAVLNMSDGAFLGLSGNLDVQPGAVLQAQTLESSAVQLAGAGTTVRGTIEPILTISASVSLVGNVSVASTVLVSTTGASLDISDYLMTVGGDFATASDGVLIMDGTIGTTLDVAGTVSFGGGSTDGLLTAGTIRVGEDFFAGGGSPTSFAPTGIHGVVFDGSLNRTVFFDNPGPLGQRFVLAWFDRAAITFVNSDFTVLADMQVLQGTVEASGYSVSLQGSLSDPGGGFSYDELHLIGDVTAIPSAVTGPVFIDGTVDWPTASTITGTLTVDGFLGVNPALLSVTGNVAVNGDLNVPAGSELSTDGILTLAAGSTMDVDGTVTATGGCVDGGATITGTGTHPCGSPFTKVWVGGDAGGPTDTENPNNWSPVGVPVTTDVVLIPATANDPILSDVGEISGLTVGAGATVDLNGFDLTITGDLDAEGPISNGLMVLAGAGSVLEGSVDDLLVSASRAISGPLTLAGDLITTSTLTIGAFTLSVTGNLTTQGAAGRLNMGGTGTVDVEGNVLFDGASEAGWLVDGQILVAGDFTASNTNSPFSFVGSNNHRVVFDGVTSQNVNLVNPGTGAQRFHHLDVFNSASGVTLASDVVATGDFDVNAAATLIASGVTVSVGTSFNISAGTSLSEVIAIGDWTSVSNSIPANLTVSTGFVVPNSFTVVGNVTTTSTLTIGAFTLSVTGDLTTQGAAGRLNMGGTGTVDVEGNVLFDGASEAGWLVDGQILVAGDFTASNTNSPFSFVGSNNHRVVFDGVTSQNVNLVNPGTGAQRFHHFDVFNSASGVTLASDVVATGDFDVNAAATLIASGVTVSVGTSFNISAGTSLSEVIAIGDWTSVSNSIPANLTVSTGFVVPNSFTVVGNVTTTSTLTIGAFTLSVTGDLTTQGAAGRLNMGGTGTVDVEGNVLFDGASEAGWLVNGQILVAGDFTASNTNSPFSFVGSNNHRVVFDGVTSQNVNLVNPGTGAQRFHHFDVFNSASGVTLASDVVATGDFDVNAAATLIASGVTVSVGTSFNISAGTSLSEVIAIGDWTSVTNVIPANLTVNSAFVVPNSFTVIGNVTTTSTLTIGALTLSVTGDLTTQGASGRLNMGGTGTVDVEGNVLFDGASEAGWLVDGQILVAGDFTASNTNSPFSFVGSNDHRVVFDGATAQAVNLVNPGTGAQRFHHFDVFNNTATTTLLSDVVATGEFFVDPDATLDASSVTVSVGASFNISGGTSLSEVVAIGSWTSVSNSIPANLTVNSAFIVPNSFTVVGNVTTNTTLTIGALTLSVTGDLTTQGASGRLSMAGPGTVDVAGNVLFDGASEAGWLVDGQMLVAGDFTANTTNSPFSFVGSSSHLVTFDGTAAQTVTFANPGTGAQRFQDVSVENFAATTFFASDVVVLGQFQTFAGVTVDATTRSMSVGGAFLDGSDGIFLQELIIVGDLTAMSGGVAADVTVNAAFTMPSSFNVIGDFTTNQLLTIGANTLTVSGDFTTQGASGRLSMANALGAVGVDGDVLFDGATTAGWLTDGRIFVAGNFTANTTNSPFSFVSSNNHTVLFDGDGLTTQVVSLTNPGTTQQRFQDLTLTFPADVSLSTSAVVMGTFDVDDVATTLRRPALSASVLDVRGTMNVLEMTVVGVPIRLQTTVAGPSHLLQNVEFQGMDPADIQLYLELPGGANFPLVMSGMTFDPQNFTTGAYLQTVKGPGGFPAEDFQAVLQFPFPAGAQPPLYIQGAGTQVIWP